MIRRYSVAKVTAAGGATTVHSGSGLIGQAILLTDGTNNVTVQLADGTTELLTLAADGADMMRSVPLAGEIAFTQNLTVTVSGTGGSCFVLFTPI